MTTAAFNPHSPRPIPTSRQTLRTHARCSIEPHKRHDTATRRTFVQRILAAFFLASTPSQAEQTLDASIHSPSSTVSPLLDQSPPRPSKWGYAPGNGPKEWAQLSEEWKIAADGTRQSPIPLSYRTTSTAADVPRPSLTTNPAKFSVRLRTFPSAENSALCLEPYIPPPPPLVGDAPPVDTYTPPPIPALVTLPASSSTYALKSLHFHVPAEHMFEATPAPMEIHFVFDKVMRVPSSPQSQNSPPPSDSETKDTKTSDPFSSTPVSLTSSSPFMSIANAADDITTTSDPSSFKGPLSTLIVAMLATLSGEGSPWLSSILQDFTASAGQDGKGPGIVKDLDMASILPPFEQSDIYMYKGSLTVPPCTENVQWLVLTTRLPVNQSDLDTISAIQGYPNARPLQNVNGRQIIRFRNIAS